MIHAIICHELQSHFSADNVQKVDVQETLLRLSAATVVDSVLLIVENMVQSTTKHWTMLLLILSYIIVISVVIAKRVNPLIDLTKESASAKRREEHVLQPSLSKIMSINTAGRFSLTSMAVQHRSSGSWYLPHLHDKYSAGWNRTVSHGSMGSPMACNIRFLATALEKTLKGFTEGGTGYLKLSYLNNKKTFYYGFDSNETRKLHCYYSTNKGFGSEFLDTPKTLSVAIYCPVSMDQEIGEFNYKNTMIDGNYCRALADKEVDISVFLRPTNYKIPSDLAKSKMSADGEIYSEAVSSPASLRILDASLRILDATSTEPLEEDRNHQTRTHAVCTVQTFRNAQTGPMLFLFVSYYHRLGWKVIVYDRFGFHKEFIEDLLSLPGFDYHPYTVFQLVNPLKYSTDYAKKQGFGYKIYYNMEKNWNYGRGANGTITDTADQDGDKVRTYDHSRVEYAHLNTVLYVDSDELLYCPQASTSVKTQRKYQMKMMSLFIAQGIEEMRIVRLPYAGLAPSDTNTTDFEYRSKTDLTLHTSACMQTAFNSRNMTSMLGCWSDASSYDDFPKSADMGGVCPFHYNHWSCDGLKGGGRDHERASRCRCKVAFDLLNHMSYRPEVNRCHLLHFNNNKYRFQLKRIQQDIEKQSARKIRAGHPVEVGPAMSHGEMANECPMYDMFKHSASH